MIRTKSVISPTLDAKGSFPIVMDEYTSIKRDVVSRLITNTASVATIPMADTSQFLIGQTIVIQDSAASEQRIISAVTPATSLTVSVNMANTYTVARGGRVTVVDVTQPITATATGGGVAIPMTNTAGFVAAVGQLVVISDSAGAELCVVNTVTLNTQITVTANLVNSYTVARGGRVTVVGNPGKASVAMSYPNAGTTNKLLTCSWAVGANVIIVIVQTGTAADQANVLLWAVTTTAEVVGVVFTAIADGE